MVNNYCLDACGPTQVLNINPAINDFSNINIYNTNGNLLCNECLEYSYTMDGVNWSCWMKYSDAGNILFEQESDYFIRIKINEPIGKVEIDGIETTDYSTSLFKCFDFTQLSKISSNLYNPYANMENAMGLYQALSDTVSNIIGIPIYYIKLKPNEGSKDITFKEYTLMNVDSIKQIKLIIKDNQMPSSKPEFSDFGFDFSTDWETEISKNVFASAFGPTAKPMEGDLVYIPMMKRMWLVNNSYDEKNEGLMWQSTVFKVLLIKYEDRGSVDLGDVEAFVEGLVKNKYEDIFGNDENRMSGQETVEAPMYAADPVFRVFESDAIRKYVKMSEGLESINTKLISSPKYNRGALISENMYDWTSITEESFISYQKQFCGNDATIAFIITFGQNYCKGELLKVGRVNINIDMTPTNVSISILDLVSINLQPNKTYFIYTRWNKQMNILELSAAEYVWPDLPKYKLQNFHYKFDIDNTKTAVVKYDIELEQSEYKDIILYSFDGKITNIKVYDKYIDNVTELLQMLPTNQHLIINDVARKFVTLPGIQSR